MPITAPQSSTTSRGEPGWLQVAWDWWVNDDLYRNERLESEAAAIKAAAGNKQLEARALEQLNRDLDAVGRMHSEDLRKSLTENLLKPAFTGLGSVLGVALLVGGAWVFFQAGGLRLLKGGDK